jgi:hypothetical protein
VGRGVAAVSLQGQDGAGVEPADIRGRRTFHDDFGAFEAEGTDALAGVFYHKFQWLAVLGPERSADVVVAGGQDLEFGLTLVQGRIYLLQQLLRRDAFVLFIKT